MLTISEDNNRSLLRGHNINQSNKLLCGITCLKYIKFMLHQSNNIIAFNFLTHFSNENFLLVYHRCWYLIHQSEYFLFVNLYGDFKTVL